VETGELKLRDPNQPRVQQTSPVAVAGLLVAAGAGGGLLLNQLTEVGEGAFKSEILNVSTKGRGLWGGGCVCVWGGGVIAGAVSRGGDRVGGVTGERVD
jgi:hypothetical protein